MVPVAMESRARKPGPERREDIVKAVLRIIGVRGLTSLTTAAVAEEIGLTSGALFRHFASRDEILEAVALHAAERLEGTFPDPSLPPLERALLLAANRVRLLGAEPGLAWLLLSEQAFLTLPADAVGRLRALAARSARYLLDALREGQAAGAIRNDIEPEVLLVPLMGTVHALVGMRGVHRAAARDPDRDPERVLAALKGMLAAPRRTAGRAPNRRRGPRRRSR